MSYHRRISLALLMLLIALVAAACNLGASDEQTIGTLTATSVSGLPTRTPIGGFGVQTTRTITGTLTGTQAVTALPPLNRPTNALPPTLVVVQRPTVGQFIPAQPTSAPINIAILSPVPGNVVAGNVQVLGAASHPQFLQYQLEYGPDPNNGNLWYPATSPVQQTVNNGLLGIWNTSIAPDGNYQLRLRVYLRDGSTLTTVVNNIRIQNRINTPVPSATQSLPRPIAAFSVDQAEGRAPLTVRFTNQSSGDVTSVAWTFGDGTTSAESSPAHTYTSPGLYNVVLTVNGPGGSSNVSRQINAQAQNPPVANFRLNPASGTAPITVQFVDESSGTINAYSWNFSDGTTSTERNPVHTFNTPGTYNIFLQVTGPGGSSNSTRQLVVLGLPTQPATNLPPEGGTPLPAPTQAVVVPSATSVPPTALPTSVPPTVTSIPATIAPPVAGFTTQNIPGDPFTFQFSNTSTGEINGYQWDFGDGATSNETSPAHTYAAPGQYTVVLQTNGPGGSHSVQTVITVSTPLNAAFGLNYVEDSTSTIQFSDLSTGEINAWAWDFGDGATSGEQNPQHTYVASGAYTVTLMLTGSDGATTSTAQTVNPVVGEPVGASFSFDSPEGIPLTVQFNDQSTGQIASYAWDFGDGVGRASDRSPSYSYSAGGTYTVTLTVTGYDGSTASAQQPVTIAAPAGQEPTAQEPTGETPIEPTKEPEGGETPDDSVLLTTPIVPDVQPLYGALRPIYENGANNGREAHAFARAGDELVSSLDFLAPFGAQDTYNLDVNGGLQAIVDWYSTDLGGYNSLLRSSYAAADGWRAGDLLDPARADLNVCDTTNGETPLACELRVSNASVILLSIGYHDVQAGTDRETFTSTLDQILRLARDNGVVPVLYTIRPGGDAATTQAFNEIILERATEYQIPVVNSWRLLNGLADPNLVSSPTGAGDLSDSATTTYAINALNLNTLRVLDAVRNSIFPDAPTPE